MPFAIEELQNGITYWQGTSWPQDFHNQFYQDLPQVQNNFVFNNEWWNQFIPILRSWLATRPLSSVYLTTRVQDRFQNLNDLWANNIAQILGADIQDLEWVEIEAFAHCVAEIKNVSSPVFTSKFCHFLAPRIFPVIDNKAMGNRFETYKEYYNAGRDEWLQTNPETRKSLVDLLHRHIDGPLFGGYPTKCKIIELCFIGRHNNG